MKKMARSDMTAPNKAPCAGGAGELRLVCEELRLMREEMRLMRKALEDIASKLTPQCPQYPQWWHTPTPAAPHWDRTPEFPTNWDGTPRVMC